MMYQPISTVDDSQYLSSSRSSSPIPSSFTATTAARHIDESSALSSHSNKTTSSSSSSSTSSSSSSSSSSSFPAISPESSASADSDFHVKVVLIGSPPLIIGCTLDTKLIDLKQKLFAQQLVDPSKDVRMIYLGRVIKDDEVTLKALHFENGHAIHAFSTEKDKDKDKSSGQSSYSSSRATDDGPSNYLRVNGVGAFGRGHAHDRDADINDSDDVRLARVRVVSELDGDVDVVHGGDEFVWVQDRRGGGDVLDLICGFALGIFLGPISLIWLLNRQLPFRQKTGILFGIMANLTLYFWSGNQQAGQAANNPSP